MPAASAAGVNELAAERPEAVDVMTAQGTNFSRSSLTFRLFDFCLAPREPVQTRLNDYNHSDHEEKNWKENKQKILEQSHRNFNFGKKSEGFLISHFQSGDGRIQISCYREQARVSSLRNKQATNMQPHFLQMDYP